LHCFGCTPRVNFFLILSLCFWLGDFFWASVNLPTGLPDWIIVLTALRFRFFLCASEGLGVILPEVIIETPVMLQAIQQVTNTPKM
jgi:hypothetical protein